MARIENGWMDYNASHVLCDSKSKNQVEKEEIINLNDNRKCFFFFENKLLTLNVKSDYIAYTKLQNINFMASAKLNKLILKWMLSEMKFLWMS